jgi:hypothetical protein
MMRLIIEAQSLQLRVSLWLNEMIQVKIFIDWDKPPTVISLFSAPPEYIR